MTATAITRPRNGTTTSIIIFDRFGLRLEKITEVDSAKLPQNYQIAYEAPILRVFSHLFYINSLNSW